ncbi:MAG: N-acetyltransferase family protein [Halobacteriaceae archaeon]
MPDATIEAATTGTTPAELREGIAGPGRAFLVCEDDGICGFASAVWDAEETGEYAGEGDAELRALYVAPERWGEGIGTRLLAAAAAAVPDRERFVLECLRGNERAQRFYESRGF